MAQVFTREAGEGAQSTTGVGDDPIREQPRGSKRGQLVADAVFVTFALVAVFVRARALAKAGAPPGFDGGDWLGLARGLLGRPVTPHGIAASPVVPLLTYGSVTLFGAEFTFVSFGALLATLPGAGVYVVLRQRIAPLDAALVSVLVVACAGSGEAASWGGYPQLLALGLLPIALVIVDRTFEGGEPKLAVLAGFALLSVVLISDFVFTFAALATIPIVVARLPHLIRLIHWRRVVRLLLLVAAPLVLAVPLEVQIAQARVEAVLKPAGSVTATPSAFERINFVFGDRPVLWRIVLLAGVAALVLLWERRSETQWRVGAILAVLGLGLTTVFSEPRLAYLLPTAAALSVALWSAELRRLSRVPVFALLAGVACLAQFQTLPAKARLQASTYQALTPGVVAAIDWVKSHSDTSALIAVTPYHDGPAMGWWIEGLAGRRTLNASNLRWLHFASERATAEEAARLFSNGVPTDVVLRKAKAMHVTLVFIDKRWESFQSGRITTLRRDAPGTVAFENGAVVVLTTARVS